MPRTDATSTATATTTSTAGTGLAAKVERIGEKVDALIQSLHTDAGKTTTDRLEKPTSVAEQVKAELARRDEATKKAEADQELGKLKETVQGLAEKTPEVPVRRIERLMGWRNA